MRTVNSSGGVVRLGIVMLAAGYLLAWTTVARAQTATATLFIEARDSTGAPLAGVEVRLVNVANALERVVTTSASGTASVPLLPAGSYTATARMSGF